MKKLLFAFTMMFAFAAPKFLTGENEGGGSTTTTNATTEEKQEEVPATEQVEEQSENVDEKQEEVPAEQKEEAAPSTEGDEQG